jgi:hypothetical protein
LWHPLKNLKNKLCFLNLVLFLASFGLLSFSGYSSINNSGPVDHQHLLVSSAHNDVSGNTPQISEKNETENDDTFEVQAFDLPFLISNIQIEFFHQTFSSFYHNKVDKTDNLIYKKVCNFRV